MKSVGIIMAMMATLALGGCNIHKQPRVVDKVKQVELPLPKATLDNLDVRVTNLEQRLDKAKAARAAKPAVPSGKPYPYYVK